MSIASYRRNVSAGVTSRYHPTCFPAALEQVSPRQSLDPSTYIGYVELLDEIEALEGQAKRKINPMYVNMYERFAEELGTSYEQLTFIRLREVEAFRTGVRGLLRDGCRVVVDIITDNCIPRARGEGVVHSLGLRSVSATGDAVKVVSNWVPEELSGEVLLEDLFPHVAQINDPPRERFPFNDCNLLALPA